MYLYIDKSKYGHQTLYVGQSYRNEQGRNTTKIIENLGRYEDLAKIHEDPIAWAKSYIAELNLRNKENRTVTITYSANEVMAKNQEVLFEGGYLFLQKFYYSLGLHKICKEISKRYTFKYDLSDILATLVYGRILYPTSKFGTYEYAQKMLEKKDFQIQDVYRALEVIAKEKDYIQAELYKYSKKFGKRSDRILYYDCTNYYFEIEHENGMRKYGHSKENRPNPIIEMGLFMDGDGIPLAFCLHEGNRNEQKTLQPLEEQIIRDFGNARFVVCTDAGLSSVSNRRFNDIAGRAFITAQSIKKMKDFQKEWALSSTGWRLPGEDKTFNLDDILSDEEKREKYRLYTFYKEQWFNENDIEQRYIMTFSIKYMDYQRTIRNEQIERAVKALESEVKSERSRQSDFKRFIVKTSVTPSGEVAEKKIYGINYEKIAEEERYDGFYCVATNLDDTAADIISVNHKRREIEESFRIMKTEFSARPVYLSRDDRIIAHFTTCFLALTVFRFLERSLGHKYTCPQILDHLKAFKFFKTKEGYLPAYVRDDFTDDIHNILGARTDFRFISFSSMKKISSASKKLFT